MELSEAKKWASNLPLIIAFIYASLKVANVSVNESIAKFATFFILFVVKTDFQLVAFFAMSNTPVFSADFLAISSI